MNDTRTTTTDGKGAKAMKGTAKKKGAASAPDDKKLLTTRQVAERIGVDERTIRRWAAMGKIRPKKIGGVVRYKPEEVDRVVDKGF